MNNTLILVYILHIYSGIHTTLSIQAMKYMIKSSVLQKTLDRCCHQSSVISTLAIFIYSYVATIHLRTEWMWLIHGSMDSNFETQEMTLWAKHALWVTLFTCV